MVLRAIRDDVSFLFFAWRGLLMPRQTNPHPVTGRWQPTTVTQRLGAFVWSVLGALVITVLYPLIFVGLLFRRQAQALEYTASRVGWAVVGLFVILAWAAVGVAGFPVGSAVGAGIGVAVGGMLFGIGLLAHKYRLRSISYPAFLNTLLFPPVVVAYFVPAVSQFVFPQTSTLVSWLLTNIFRPVGLASVFSRYFTLEGGAYLAFWFGTAVLLGWALAAIVTLAERVRTKADQAGRNRIQS